LVSFIIKEIEEPVRKTILLHSDELPRDRAQLGKLGDDAGPLPHVLIKGSDKGST